MKRTLLPSLWICMLLAFPWCLAGQTVLTTPVGIGTKTPDTSALEEIFGGSQLFVPLASKGVVYHYMHVASYTVPGVTGTLEIILPAAIDPNKVNELRMTIDGYAWPWGPWKIEVGGFPGFNQCAYSGAYATQAWCGAGASITGAFPYSYVRLGYDSALSRFVVLLGTTTTFWDDPTVEVTDATFNNEDSVSIGLGKDWSITALTSEASIQYVNTIYNASNHLVVGQLTGEGIIATGNGSDPSVNFEVFGGSSLSVPVTPPPAVTTNGPIHHFRDLVGFLTGGPKGDYEIAIPNSATDENSVTMTISATNWQVTVGGIENFGNVRGWSYYSVLATGNPPMVRLAYDTSLNDYVIVLGTTSLAWTAQTIEVTDYSEGIWGRTSGSKGSGWGVALLTSETNLANIVTPSYVSLTGGTVPASNCGSLAKAAGCITVNVAGVQHYIPYW